MRIVSHLSNDRNVSFKKKERIQLKEKIEGLVALINPAQGDIKHAMNLDVLTEVDFCLMHSCANTYQNWDKIQDEDILQPRCMLLSSINAVIDFRCMHMYLENRKISSYVENTRFALKQEPRSYNKIIVSCYIILTCKELINTTANGGGVADKIAVVREHG